jgi:anti-sigma B factor antagonist
LIEVTVERRGAVTVATIVGQVDGMTAETLLSQLQARVGEGDVQLVADLSGVGYTSSAGLRTLLAVVRDARRRGGDLRLAAVQAPVRKVLELSGFTSILKLHADVESAVASYLG